MNRYRFNEEEHVHLLDGKPLQGTSTVTSIIAKVLTWWASGCAVTELGWTNPKTTDEKKRIEVATNYLDSIKLLSPIEWLKKLDSAYSAHSKTLKKSATKGSDLHYELEKWVKGQISGNPIEPDEKILKFVQWAEKNVKRFIASEVHCYSETYWLGGICDVIWEMNDGTIIIGDFKSAKEVYLSHFVQVAGYHLQLEENGGFDKDGNKILELEKVGGYAVVPFGTESGIPRFRYDTDKKVEAFKAALELYKQNKDFN